MTTKEKLKTKLGKEIWVIPTGNSVERSKILLKEQIRTATLVKVGTKLFTIKNVQKGHGGSYPIDGGLDNLNYGYIPFLTEEDAKNYFVKIELINEIKSLDFNKISLEKLTKIRNELIDSTYTHKYKKESTNEEGMSLN